MSSNISIYSTLLTLEPLYISQPYVLPVFMFGTLTYCAILLFNLTLLLTIVVNQKLHKPMYILLCNMQLNDIVGATALFPQIMSHLLTQTRTITYSVCFAQAFLIHIYGTGAFLILIAMAYDRYTAICCPLHYNTLMSPINLFKIILTVWAINFAMIGSQFALSYRQHICSTTIVDAFCNNPSLMKLICGDIRLNNYYGLAITAFVHILSVSLMLFTYIQILITCVSRRQSDAKSKAIQTCGTHLVVYLCLEFCTLFTLISHRFDNVPHELRRVMGVSIMIFPPFINPLLYGLKTKEIQQNIISFFCKKKVHS